jgi:hypothetical protein
MSLWDVVHAWRAIRPIQSIKKRRARKRRAEQAHQSEAVQESVMKKKWYKSLTIKGLAGSGVALALGTFFGIGDAEVATLSTRVMEWAFEGVQIGGLLVAAYGRKRATAPLGN